MPSAAILIEESALRIPASALTLDGFREWAHSADFPQQGRISFIQGEVHLEMSPEEIQTHNFTKGDVFGWLWGMVKDEDLGRIFADRALLVNKEADLATEPDVMLCLWNSLEQGRVTLKEVRDKSGRQVEVHGSPDLVVEIISRSSVLKDKRHLRRAYFQAGIPEYWLIDARGKRLEFEILRAGKAGYRATPVDANGWQQSAVLGRAVMLTRQRDRIGGWQYTLKFGEV